MVQVGALGPWAVQLVIYPTGSWSAGQAEVLVPQRQRLTLMSCVASTARSVRTVRAGRPKSDLVQLSDDPLSQAQPTLLLQLLPVVLVRRIEGFHRCRLVAGASGYHHSTFHPTGLGSAQPPFKTSEFQNDAQSRIHSAQLLEG